MKLQIKHCKCLDFQPEPGSCPNRTNFQCFQLAILHFNFWLTFNDFSLQFAFLQLLASFFQYLTFRFSFTTLALGFFFCFQLLAILLLLLRSNLQALATLLLVLAHGLLLLLDFISFLLRLALGQLFTSSIQHSLLLAFNNCFCYFQQPGFFLLLLLLVTFFLFLVSLSYFQLAYFHT